MSTQIEAWRTLVRGQRVEAGAPDVDIVSPIYQAEYEAVMPDSSEARLLLNTTVVEKALERADSLDDVEQYEETPVRILDVDVGVGSPTTP